VDEVKEIKTIDGAWAKIDRIAGPLFPPKIRKYFSLLWMTLFVLCLFVVNLVLKLSFANPEDRRFMAAERIFRQPLFLVPYNIGLLLLLLLVFTSKPSTEYEYLRALIFGIALAAILGQMLIFFVPW
jgi:hypothetical protein